MKLSTHTLTDTLGTLFVWLFTYTVLLMFVLMITWVGWLVWHMVEFVLSPGLWGMSLTGWGTVALLLAPVVLMVWGVRPTGKE